MAKLHCATDRPSDLLQLAVHGAAEFPRRLESSLADWMASVDASWAAARWLDPDGITRWRVVGGHPPIARRALASALAHLIKPRGRGVVRVGASDWHLSWWSGSDALLCVAWTDETSRCRGLDAQPLLTALEAASLHGRIAGLESNRRQLLERASHEVRNSLFTLRRTVELEAQSRPEDRALTDIFGRIRALFLIYSHLADNSFESADVRPLIAEMLPTGVDLGLTGSLGRSDEPVVVADRQSRWLAQALHELTSADSAPVEAVTISIEDGVLDIAIRWRAGHRLDQATEPIRWAIAEQLVREGLRGRLDDTGEALHIRCIPEDLRVGVQVRQMSDRWIAEEEEA